MYDQSFIQWHFCENIMPSPTSVQVNDEDVQIPLHKNDEEIEIPLEG